MVMVTFKMGFTTFILLPLKAFFYYVVLLVVLLCLSHNNMQKPYIVSPS